MSLEFLNELNPQQRQAVCHTQGPLMIVAGAGTGKTRTLTCRIAYLVREAGVDPANILALTFTRRAAWEMKQRIAHLLGEKESMLPEIGTFHSVSAKILREEISVLGYDRDFVILTEEEQIDLLREAGAKSRPEANACLKQISAFKNRRPTETVAPPLFSEYQSALKQRNAADFDDLILLALRLFETDSQILNRYRDRFRYILVDEYQDLNPPQYMLVRILTGPNQNLCVVGDADQAIYAFRGAQVENFLNFQKDYPRAQILRLEQNYRSSPVIVKAAEQVVSRNTLRMEKRLWSDAETGERIRIMEVDDEKQEAGWIVSRIETLLGGTSMFHHDTDRIRAGEDPGHYSFSDMAVLFRLRAQARPLQATFEQAGIPCRLLSGERLDRRPEIRQVRSMLRFLAGPERDAVLPGMIKASLIALSETREQSSLPDLIRELSGICNLDEVTLRSLKAMASPYLDLTWGASLQSFLHDLCLGRESDLFDPRAQAVTLLTMHAAKGLEFPVVFICGLEQGLMPYARDGSPSADEIEEERRLFHVGITRAMKELYLIHARTRILYGSPLPGEPSPFLKDIEEALFQADVLKKKSRPPQKENPQLGLF